MRKTARYAALLAPVLLLQGCLAVAAADLAATTVLTAGKLAVKGTGALIGAAIPDRDKEKEPAKERDKPAPQPEPVRAYEARPAELLPDTAE